MADIEEYFDVMDADVSLKCATSAQMVSLIPCSEIKWHTPWCVELDADAVRGLVAQLQAWLNHQTP